jgi:hypothetical protein
MRTHLSKEGPKNPDNEDDSAQDLDDNDLGVPNEAMQVEGLLAARGLKIESGLEHNPLSPGV